MNILVTGGAGYIGRHVCVELLKKGHKVVSLDNYSNSSRLDYNGVITLAGFSAKNFFPITGDFGNEKEVFDLLKKHNIEHVIHLAAKKSVLESDNNPLMYYENNVGKTLRLLKAMDKANVKNLTFASSCAVYGEKKSELHETDQTRPASTYGHSKLEIELILEKLYKADKNWSITIFRKFNVVGCHPSGMVNDAKGSVIQYLMDAIIKSDATFKLNGNTLKTADGTSVRDYIHVCDVATAYIESISQAQRNKSFYKIYNLGSGVETSTLQLINQAKAVTNSNINYEVVPANDNELEYAKASIDKIMLYTDWKPKYSLGDAIRHSFAKAIEKRR